MRVYEFRKPRAALGLAAVAMASITMAAMVVLPAALDASDAPPYTEAMGTTMHVEVTGRRSSLDEDETALREEMAEPVRAGLDMPEACVPREAGAHNRT